MSMGYGGWARKTVEDEKTVIYEYGGYNLNDPCFRNNDKILDGLITIDKSAFIEPEIHTKIRKRKSGRKYTTIKRIVVEPDPEELLENGLVQIENYSNSWSVSSKNGTDHIAVRLVHEILISYQKEEEIPEVVSLHV